MPLPKKRLDRIVNIILRIHPAGQHLLMIPQMFVQHVDEIPAAIRAGDLAVAEHVADGQQLILQNLDAVPAVGFAAVVAVAEMEQVNVPLIGAVMGV